MEGGPWWCSAQTDVRNACVDAKQQSPSRWWENHFNWILIIILSHLSGGQNDEGAYADILEFSDSEEEEKWTKVGEMSRSWDDAGVSVVSFDKYKKYCQNEVKINDEEEIPFRLD